MQRHAEPYDTQSHIPKPTRLALRTASLLAVLIFATAHGVAQRASALTGDVRDAQGKPLPGITVSILTPTGITSTATSDANGTFTFPTEPAAPYTLHAENTRTKAHTDLAISEAATAAGHPIHLVLGIPSATAMEFTDAPGFTIAGVTDWTAVGGHGSDATLRTSEDLARETAGLPSATSPAATLKLANTAEQTRLEAAQRAAPQNYEANKTLGDFYLRTGNDTAAEPILRTASTLHHGAAPDEYALARACEGLGDFQQGNQHIQRALAQQDTADFQSLAGRISEHLGQPLEAVEHFQRAAALDPSEQNYFNWGSELLLHRAIWQAAEVFAKGAAVYPQSTRLRTGWGAALFGGAKYDEAAERLCEASALDPANRETYRLLGKAALAAPEPLPCAQQRFTDLLRREPQNADAHYYTAMLLLQNGPQNRPAAATHLRTALQLNPKLADAALQLGILEAAGGRQPSAIAFYREAIQADPNLAETHFRLGRALDRSGQHDEAKRELDLHARLVQTEAEAVEQQRRQVKQFLVTLPPASPAASAAR